MHEVRRTVRREHGGEYLSRAPRAYRSRAVNVDVAHEAIRPIPVARTPESLAGAVGPDEVRLYALIRDRMLASQMAEARSEKLEEAYHSSTTMDITWLPRRAHRDLPRCFAPRNAKALHEAARVPPMDSRDNRQHRIRHQQVVPSYSGAVAPIYSGVDIASSKTKPPLFRDFAATYRERRRSRWMLRSPRVLRGIRDQQYGGRGRPVHRDAGKLRARAGALLPVRGCAATRAILCAEGTETDYGIQGASPRVLAYQSTDRTIYTGLGR